MTNENTKGMLTIVFAGVGYAYAIFPAIHAAFNPITFWQKLVMFFTLDLLTLGLTLIMAAAIIEGLNRLCEILTS